MRGILLFIALLFPLQSSAAIFIDTAGHPHEVYIDKLGELQIVEGYGNGIFRPDILISRAEFLKILMLAVYGEQEFPVERQYCFTDFVGPPQWYWPHACLAKEYGIIHGYPDGTFRGVDPVNLAEALKMAVNAWSLPFERHEYANGFWFIPYMEVAAGRGLFTFFAQSKPEYLLTRSDMAYLIVAFGEPIQDLRSPVFPGAVPLGSTPPASSPDSLISVCGNGLLEHGEQCDDGNLINGDGCSEICVVVAEPVRHGALRIDQRPIAVDDITPGAKDVALIAFDVVAGRQDSELTNAAFRADIGDLDDARNFRLYADYDGNGTAETEVASAVADGNNVSFNDFRVLIRDGYQVHMEVRADLLENIGAGQLSVGFDLANARFFQAVGAEDGRDLTGIILNGADCTESSICWISVNTIATPTFDVVERGSLFVEQDSVPIRNRQLLGGELSDDLLNVRMRSEGERIEVTDLRFTGVSDSVDELVLFEQGSSVSIAAARSGDCSPVTAGMFCAKTSIFLNAGDEKGYSVRARVKSDQSGGVSGDTVTLSLGTAAQSVEARGTSTQEDLAQNDGDGNAEGEVFIGVGSPGANQVITGSTHDVVMAQISSIANANPDGDESAVPTGSYPFALFRFNAADHSNSDGGLNKATIRTLVFNVNATNVEFSGGSFALYNLLDSSTIASCTESGVTGNITVTCSNLDVSSVSTSISNGDSIILALRGMILNPQVSQGTSVLQASLQNLGNRGSPGTVEWDDEDTNIGWIDTGETTVKSTLYRK